MSKVRFKQAEVERLLRAAKKCGFADVALEVLPDGTLKLSTGALAARDQEGEDFGEIWDKFIAEQAGRQRAEKR
jgi:hypothetical protein